MKINYSKDKGMTLIEILVVIFIVAIVMTLVVTRGGVFEGRKMRQTANHMASTIRYLYNKAATEGQYVRLVIDIDEKNYWAESSSEPVLLGADEDKKEDEDKKNADEDGEKVSQVGFSKDETYLFKTKKLPSDVFIKDVHVEHIPNLVDAGQVAIHFFPNGYVEYAIINLRDEDDEEFYAIETIPLSGQVNIYHEYKGPDS